MTAVRTKFEAGCYAVTASSQKILILDRFRKITVASVDNFKPLFDAMGVATEKDIEIEHLNNACILYAMAAEVSVELGLFADGDKAVIAFCRSQISDEVNSEDADLLLHELSTSWQYIAKHPLLAKYVQLGEFLKSDSLGCQFYPLGAFELFVHDYFTGCVRAFIKSGADELALLKEWTNLIFSSLHGIGLCQNRFLKTEFFLAKIQKVLDETGPHRAEVEAFARRTKQEYDTFKSMWFVHVRDWANIELEDIESFQEAGASLTELLENKQSTAQNEELEFQLIELRKQLMLSDDAENPLVRSRDFSKLSGDVRALNILVKEVIVYTIVTYAFRNGIVLYAPQVIAPLPAYRLAGKNAAAEDALIAQLLAPEESSKFLPFELYAIAKNARSELLREIVNQVVNSRARHEELFSLTNAFNGLAVTPLSSLVIMQATGMRSTFMTHQYRRLQGVLVGKQSQARLTLMKDVYPAKAASSVNPDEDAPIGENPKDTLHEALNLQKPGVCNIL